jgi:tetratricopeptide (TPR) repeat protein
VIGRVESAWKSFAHTPSPSDGGSSHFTTLASNRPDIWRVALREFDRHPLGGIGQDNFAASYIRQRRTYEQPRWTHSIELRLLTHTGIVGALLFAIFLVAVVTAALRARRGRERATAAILLVPLVVWLVQGSIDWFWEYPALSVPALAFAAAAGGLWGGDTPPPGGRVAPTRLRLHSRIAALAGAALVLGAVAALAIPFAAARQVREAIRIWPEQPARAYGAVRSATDLLPFDAQLYLVGGSVALNLGEYPRAHAWLSEARRRDDENWLTPFVLGLIEGQEGRRKAARADLLRAEALNPLEPAIGTALARLDTAHPLTFAQAQALLAPHIVTPSS